MATLLSAINDTLLITNSNLKIFGTQSGTEIVKILSNQVTGLSLDSSIEQIELLSNIADYQFQIIGNILKINTLSQPLAEITLDSQPIQLVFADGTAKATISGLDAARLGLTSIETTMQTLPQVNLNKSIISTVSETLSSLFDLNSTSNPTQPVDENNNNTDTTVDNSPQVFTLDSGISEYTVDNFNTNTVLDIPEQSLVQVRNFDYDGNIDLVISHLITSQSITIHLTGIDLAADGQISDLNSFISVFGTDSFI